MADEFGKCPECGASLRRRRSDRQRAGKREVTLEWSICPSCRRVRLERWEWLDETPNSDDTGDE